MVRRVVVIVVIVALVVFGILLSLSSLLSDVFSGVGWAQAPVIGTVFILAVVSGYYVWSTSQRHGA